MQQKRQTTVLLERQNQYVNTPLFVDVQQTKLRDSGGRTYGVLQLRVRMWNRLDMQRGREDCLAGLFSICYLEL
jgi:hypothetical protein